MNVATAQPIKGSILEASIITEIVLPVSLALIMAGMGLTLTPDHFKRIVVTPKAMSLGLLSQLLLLPLATYCFCMALGLKNEIAIGFMIIAACPGGATSNIFSHLARGDTALSVSLTAICSVVTVFSIPIIINLSSQAFLDAAAEISLPIVKTVVQIGVIIIIPVVIGMLIKRFFPVFAAKAEGPMTIFSVAFLFLIIVLVILKEKAMLAEQLPSLGPYVLMVNIFTMALGFGVGKLFSLGAKQNRTIAIEVGIQNGTLAIVIASSLLKEPAFAVPAVVYSILMFFTAGVFAYFSRRQEKIEAES